MIALKSCPRCHGDLLFNQENEFACIQCGYELPEAQKQALLARIEARRGYRLPIAA